MGDEVPPEEGSPVETGEEPPIPSHFIERDQVDSALA